MIARIWTGRVRRHDAEEYLELMRTIALPDYSTTPGNRGAWCLSREEEEAVIVTMLSFWDDMDTIRNFAGEDVEIAKYYDFDARFLLEMPERVVHYRAEG